MKAAPPAASRAAATTGEADRVDRLHYLATGFALGELEEAELRELYEELRQPGEPGIAAAQIAWRSLHHTLDLRTQMGSRFQDEVRSRIAELAGFGSEESMRRHFRRIVLTSPAAYRVQFGHNAAAFKRGSGVSGELRDTISAPSTP